MFHVKQTVRDDLENALRPLGADLEPDCLDACLRFWKQLAQTADRLNLVSRADLQQGPVRHIADALAALPLLEDTTGRHLLDIGSGGGLPGIPLALARHELAVVLLESRERKTDWLMRTVRELDLTDRVTVRQGRLEQQPAEWVAGFDYLTARAVAPPDQLLRLALPGMGSEARMLIWHSTRQQPSIQALLESPVAGRMFGVENTLLYEFASIDHISCISTVIESD